VDVAVLSFEKNYEYDIFMKMYYEKQNLLRDFKKLHVGVNIAYGHTSLVTPDLVRSNTCSTKCNTILI